MSATCFFAQFSKKPCVGVLEPAHLISKQQLDRAKAPVWDVRTFVPGCRQHHADFDHYNLVVPREAVPEGTEEIARELGLEWVLDRRFGARKEPPMEGQTNVYEAIHRAESKAAESRDG